MAERWRAVVGFEGHYEVSDEGAVRSLRRGDKKRIAPALVKAWLSQRPGSSKPVIMVSLAKRRKNKRMAVHRLVLDAFVGLRQTGQECRHLNDDRHDNRLTNLAWGTKAENAEDARRNGRTAIGERHGKTTLTVAQVREIFKHRGGPISQQKLADRYGVDRSTIGGVWRGRVWAEVTGAREADTAG